MKGEEKAALLVKLFDSELDLRSKVLDNFVDVLECQFLGLHADENLNYL